MRDILNKLFPKDEEERRSTKFVERGMEALRFVRDDHSMVMGSMRRVPSHFELRVSPQYYETLKGMDAIRDMAFFFKDELMKDLKAERLRTFGDHTVRVGISADPALGPNELYAVVLTPDRPAEAPRGSGRPAAPAPPDATRVLGAEPAADEAPTVALEPEHAAPARDEKPKEEERWGWNLTLRFPDGSQHRERLDGERWIIGRRGGTGGVPPGFRKLDLDLPATVSREQLAVELDPETFLLKRIGKAEVGFGDGASLAPEESRRLELGTPFFMEGIEVTIRK